MVTALCPLVGAVPTYEDAAACKGLCGGFPWLCSSPLYCPLRAFCTRQPDGHLHLSCTFPRCAGSLDTPPRFYVYSSPRSLTRPLWKANVHNSCHVHLKPGHLVGTLGTLPWVWLMTISVSSVCFVFLFLSFLDFKPCIGFNRV